MCHTGSSLNIGHLKAPSHHDTEAMHPKSATPYGQAFKHMSLWGPFLSKPPQDDVSVDARYSPRASGSQTTAVNSKLYTPEADFLPLMS